MSFDDERSRWWVLEWDDATFRLTDPHGWATAQGPATLLHERINLESLSRSRDVFVATDGSLKCRHRSLPARDLAALFDEALQQDYEQCATLKRQAHKSLFFGLAMFAVGASLFATYCWWAAIAPNPPRWVHLVGGLIHSVLLVLMAMWIAGPVVCVLALRRVRRVKRIERAVHSTAHGFASQDR